eukprot:TRINITY_DN3280_c0_g1_i1.p1 TRINITY_DN3280_c0_g1~~TRINITY_DN3280_c0_g1_i1.p1  ORF type:complete len:2565 (+),score=223.09 TRINITY_DN3280_c0_g1_i1:134-7828(+)
MPSARPTAPTKTFSTAFLPISAVCPFTKLFLAPKNIVSYMYTQPKSTFVSPPETQGEFTAKLLSHISKVPSTPPLTLYPDELQKVFLPDLTQPKRMKEIISDESTEPRTKLKLRDFFRRRIDQIDIEQYRLSQRLGQALIYVIHFVNEVQDGVESMDHYVLSVNATLNNLSKQAHMSLERFERLQSSDSFDPFVERPKATGVYEEHQLQVLYIQIHPSHQTNNSLIRVDDVEVYLRIILTEQQKARTVERLVTSIGWLPVSKGKEIWLESRCSMQKIAEAIESEQEYSFKQNYRHSQFIENAKQQMLTDLMGAGVPEKEAELRARRYFAQKLERTSNDSIALGKYQAPPKIIKDISMLKTLMLRLGKTIGITETDISLDHGHSFCREVYFHFSRLHTKQTLESTYNCYDNYREEDPILQTYEHLAKLAEKERPYISGKCRLMQAAVFPSKLFTGDKWGDHEMLKAEVNGNEEEIYCTVNAVTEGKVDALLQNEAKWIDMNDLERIEEILEQATTQYNDSNLLHKTIDADPEEGKVDLTPLDFLHDSPRGDEESTAERKKIGWKHLIKAYLIQRVLLMREYKRKIGYALNYFRSVRRRLTQDAIELGSKHTVTEGNLEVKAGVAGSQLKRKQTNITQTQADTTPPSLFHDSSGRPITLKSPCTTTNTEYTKRSALPLLKLVHITPDEVRLLDHNNVHVFLEATLSDLDKVMSRIMQCGTYYISQYENRFGLFRKSKKPVIDRGLVLLDLLKEECEFQYAKLAVIEKLSYIYEHTNDFDRIQAVGQALYNFMQKRPRLQLASEYFTGGYQMETRCMKEYAGLLEKLITGQVREELKVDENNENAVRKKINLYQKQKGDSKKNYKDNTHSNEKGYQVKDEAELHDPYRGAGGESYKKKLEDVLELEPMREHDLFLTHQKNLKEEVKDQELEELYEFISFEEGWRFTPPEAYSVDSLADAHESESSLPRYRINSMYSSLSEIPRILLSIQNALKSMATYYQPESGFAISALECELISQTAAEYESLMTFALSPPSNIEAEVRSLETGSLADSPEILIYSVKELAKELSRKDIYDIDPTFLSKLPVSFLKGVTFSYFEEGQYSAIKKPKSDCPKWPNLLTLLCNLLELTRLRERLINSLYESHKLSEIYKTQQSMTSNTSPLTMSEPILFGKTFKSPYVSPAVCTECKLSFAIREFDPDLQNLLCFHSHKCLKLAVQLFAQYFSQVFESGLEEVRTALHYQLMQLQLLQIAVQTNHWMYLPYTRAFAELDAVMGKFPSHKNAKNKPFTVPNSILGLRVGEDTKTYLKERDKLREKMMRSTASCFVDIFRPKYANRGFVQNAYQNFANKLQSTDRSSQHNAVSMARALKAYSFYLLHQYCDRILKNFYTIAMHLHLFPVSQSLRLLYQLFPEDELLFDCKKSYGLELTPFSLGLSMGLDELQSSTHNFELSDTLLKIPSTEDIAGMIRAVQKEVIGGKQVSYELDEYKPEALAKDYLKVEESTRKVKKWLRNDETPYLCNYDSSGFEILNGLCLIRNVLTLELAIESTHIPLKLWLQMVKNVKINTFLWKPPHKRSSILDVDGEGKSKTEAVVQEKIEEEHRFTSLEHMLRSVSHRLKVMDCALYKTCGYKCTSVMQYFQLYYKVCIYYDNTQLQYKYTCVIEALFKFLDDLPSGNSRDQFFESILSTINYFSNTSLGTATYVSADSSCFRFSPNRHFDRPLISPDSSYTTNYGRNLVAERHEDPEIIRVIKSDLSGKWPTNRLPILSAVAELPLAQVFTKLYPICISEEVRKTFLSYISLVEGKAQVEYGPSTGSAEDDSEFFVLPVEVPKLEDLKEQHGAVKEKIRLRRFRLALMSWLTNAPPVNNLEHLRNQRKILTEKTFITMMHIKEEIQFEANKFDLPRNQRIRSEVLSEINMLKVMLQKELLEKGLECIKQEQAIISDLLDKGTGLLESSIDSLRGTAATIYSNVDKDQRKCIGNSLACIQTFVTQIKNRATLAESLTTGTALIITLHDFNSSLYTLCKNVWRQQVAQRQGQVWAERKIQQQLHQQAFVEGERACNLQADMAKVQKNMEHSVAVEVGQRCYEQIYEVERGIRQCQYWRERINGLEKKLKKELREEVRQELADKELQLKNYETQFADYKATLMAQLKSEITSHNSSLAMKIQSFPSGRNSPGQKRNSIPIAMEEDPTTKAEAEAYEQLAKLQEKVHKLRLFYNMRLALQKEKYKDRLTLIKKQMTTNSDLYNQLSLSERRELILKQELVNTQQNMASFEKALKQMQSTLKEKNESLMRFHQTKNAKSQRMTELEAKLKKLSAVEAIDVNRMQMELQKKEKELAELKSASLCNKDHVETVKSSFQTQLKWMQKKLKHEESEKSAAMQKVEELQLLLAQTKVNETSAKKEEGGLWREKCKELVELCKALKNENEMFRMMVNENSNNKGGIMEEKSKDTFKRVETPYSQEVRSINKSGGFDQIMCVTGSNNNVYYPNKPPTRPSVQTRSSSHSGMGRGLNSHEQVLGINARPQTQHHPFFIKRSGRLNTGVSKSKRFQNLSFYPSQESQKLQQQLLL